MAEPRNETVVLTLNSGSSSLKFGLYRVGELQTEQLLTGQAESPAENGAQIRAYDRRGEELAIEHLPLLDARDVLDQIEGTLAHFKLPAPTAIGHRIVHGGPKLRRHCVIDDNVLDLLEVAIPFAPLHLPPALKIIRSALKHFAGVPQIACFDTTFHADLPDVARKLPIPQELYTEGIERYGFHGLSCESILHQLGREIPDRLMIAHLGNGASITAVKSGKSVDTSMGLTPTGGVIMGTRSGDLDPGILVYLAREKNLTAVMLEDLVDHQSGLFGISGGTSDMRQLRKDAPSKPGSRLAIDMFCYSVRKQIAGLISVLEGVDLLVFTGGIGENDEQVRASVCASLAWAGISLDAARNRTADNPIGEQSSFCKVLVLPSQEDEQIARHSWALSRQIVAA